MNAIRSYLLSVTAAAMICAVVRYLIGKKGTGAGIIRVICGIFLTVTMISPLAEISLDHWSDYAADLSSDAEDAVDRGKEITRQAMDQVIKQQAEAYILDKAEKLDAEVTAEVINGTGELPAPERIILHGRVSPYVRKRLEEEIFKDLGVSEECLVWTG